LIHLNPKLVLVLLNKVEAILLSDCPSLTDILLKEFATEKEVLGLSEKRANMKAKAMKLCHRDKLALVCWPSIRWTIFSILIGKVIMPTKLASRKNENIAQSRV
jgi:hypothetical protein